MMPNTTKGSGWGPGLRARTALGFVAAWAVLGIAAPAGSATLYGYHYSSSPPHVSRHEQDVLSYYLLGGPARWAVTRPPKFPSGLVITNRFGVLKDNAVAEYLTWLRDKNPVRFDVRHRRIAPLFHTPIHITSTGGLHALEVLTPPSSTVRARGPALAAATARPVLAAEVLAAPVPEPSSVATGLTLLGVAAAWRGLRRKTPR